MASLLHDGFIYTIGEQRALILHYHAASVPASFLLDPTKCGLFDAHGTHLDFKRQGQPLLLSPSPGDPLYNVFAFRWEPAFLDTLAPGASYFFKLVDGSDTHLWSLQVQRRRNELDPLATSLLANFALVDARLDDISNMFSASLLLMALNHIIVSPNPLTVLAGDSVALSATGYDTFNNPIPGLSFDWSSSDAGVASVSSVGVVTGVSENIGGVTIFATHGLITGTTHVTVIDDSTFGYATYAHDHDPGSFTYGGW